MNELVSIVMPNYNSERFLPQTIESVLNQTYTNWELLIVDDCSTDGSVALIKGYAEKDERVKLFQNEINRGAAYARNFALQKAKGKWIAFLDSDDLWMREKLEKQISFMEENGYDFTYTDYDRIDEEGQPLNERITGPKVITKGKIFRYNYIGCLVAMYNAKKMGIIQVEDELKNGRNDYALWLKAGRITPCYLLPEVLASYRIRKKSLSHGSFKKLLKYQYQLFRVGEKMCVVAAGYCAVRNFFFGALKKIFYTKKIK